MSVKSQQVTKDATAKRAQAAPSVINRVRGFAGNHTLMRKQGVPEKVQRKRYETTQSRVPGGNIEQSLQRQASYESAALTVPPTVHEVLRSPGQPLDAQTRAFMEPRFGHDFSHVRVHADARAADAASAIRARAFTASHDIVFGSCEYAPQTESGRRLISHELTHVVQQRAGVHLRGGIGSIGDAYERHADAVAGRVAHGGSAVDLVSRTAVSATTAIQRQTKDLKPEKDPIDLPQRMEFEFNRGLPIRARASEPEKRFLFNAMEVVGAGTILVVGIAYLGYDDDPAWLRLPTLQDLAEARADFMVNQIQLVLMDPDFGVKPALVPGLMSKVVTQTDVRKRSKLLGRTEGAVVRRQ